LLETFVTSEPVELSMTRSPPVASRPRKPKPEPAARPEPPKPPPAAKPEPPKPEPPKPEPPKPPPAAKPEPPKPEPPKPEPPKPEPPKPEPPKPAAAAGGVIDLPLRYHADWRTPAPTSPADLAAAVARIPAGAELVLHCPPRGTSCEALATERAKKTLALLRDRGARLTGFRLEPDAAGWRAVVQPGAP